MSHRRVHFIFKLKKKKKNGVEANRHKFVIKHQAPSPPPKTDTHICMHTHDLTHAHTHARTYARTHTHTHARTHMLTQGRLETVESVRSNGQTKGEC